MFTLLDLPNSGVGVTPVSDLFFLSNKVSCNEIEVEQDCEHKKNIQKYGSRNDEHTDFFHYLKSSRASMQNLGLFWVAS